jgi:hypothetical protein
MELDIIMLSKIKSGSERPILHVFSHMKNLDVFFKKP